MAVGHLLLLLLTRSAHAHADRDEVCRSRIAFGCCDAKKR